VKECKEELDLGQELLNQVTREEYGEKYRDHYLEQYKQYVEMADRISARRLLANSFFLTVHTSIVGALVVFLKDGIKLSQLWLIVPFLSIELLCYSWWRIVKSYRQLNEGKYKVVHLMEQNLPCPPYDIEWEMLGRGKNPKLYQPITHIEKDVPIAFGLIYLMIAVFLLCSVL